MLVVGVCGGGQCFCKGLLPNTFVSSHEKAGGVRGGIVAKAMMMGTHILSDYAGSCLFTGNRR